MNVLLDKMLHPKALHSKTLLPKVLLHIGTEKTGTTAIQAFLTKNKEVLLANGFYYLNMPGRNDYRDLPAYCLNPERVDAYFRRARVTGRQARSAFDNHFLESYLDQVNNIPCSVHTVIISSEHFASRLFFREEVEKLKNLLAQNFASIQILCYLRNQQDKISSAYSTRIKAGGTDVFDHYIRQYLRRSKDHYDERLHLWEDVFGPDNLSVGLFDRHEFHGQSLLSDFTYRLQPGLLGQLAMPETVKNESLSQRGCEILRKLNRAFPEPVRGFFVIETVRVVIIALLLRLAKGPRVQLTETQAEQVRECFRESNQRVCRRYFPSRHSLFEHIN